jgi:hypothetical protein
VIIGRNESDVWRAIGRLTPTEKRIKEAFPRGAEVDLRSGDPGFDDPANAEKWPAGRTVRAEVLAALLLGGVEDQPGRIAALRVRGALIAGPLSLAHGTIRCAWFLEDCRFDALIDLEGADSGPISLRHSRLTVLRATYARIRGMLALSDAVITGEAGEEDAVHAPGVIIEGNLWCPSLRATGCVNIKSAVIHGLVSFGDAELSNPDGLALRAGGIRVHGNMLCEGLTSTGCLRIYGAEIGGSLSFHGATLDGRGQDALAADSISVSRNLWFVRDGDKPFESRGTIVLTGSRVGRDASWTGARLQAANGLALKARRMRVGGSFYLNDGFATDDEIHLTGVHIEGFLDLVGIDCPNALLWLRVADIPGGIRDEDCNWPGRVNLDGLVHGQFAHYDRARERLAIIRRQITSDPGRIGGYRAQPYEQLAASYRDLGQDGEARTVLLAKARAARKVQPRYRRVGGYVLDALVGYGYRPSRAIAWAVSLLVAGSVYFANVRPQHVASDDTSVFNPVLYAADRLVPVVDLGRSDVWQYHGAAAVVSGLLTIIGWTLGIAIAAGATRTLSRN